MPRVPAFGLVSCAVSSRIDRANLRELCLFRRG